VPSAWGESDPKYIVGLDLGQLGHEEMIELKLFSGGELGRVAFQN